MDDQPKNVKELLVELKDASELMVDLAYAAVFFNDDDRNLFLSTFGRTSRRLSWRVHAFCLMENHYHLLLETPEPNLAVDAPRTPRIPG